jgi:hypothetical protein
MILFRNVEIDESSRRCRGATGSIQVARIGGRIPRDVLFSSHTKVLAIVLVVVEGLALHEPSLERLLVEHLYMIHT